ncbi:MAG: ABC transporter permease [Pirellulales bacterium]|nr:ABC transporter permease [Pirellulales bacterium]
MSLWKIAWRSIQQRALASTLTAVSMGLGVALVVAVLVVHTVVDRSFRRGGEGYDLIVGHKGGRLELVLNTVYYLSQPIGNIPESYRNDLLEGRVDPEILVETAIPICMGHSYRGFRVVGTVPELFEKLRYRDGQQYRFAQGENFKAENHFEGVIGATVARETRLKVGDRFKARHGVGEGAVDHAEEFTVVGILEHTGTPNDRALFVNMEGFFAIHSHASDGAGHDDEAHEQAVAGDRGEHHADDELAHDLHDHGPPSRSVTALLVCLDQSTPGITWRLEREINDGPVAQAVVPAGVIANLFEGIVGNVQLILLIMAVLIVVVAGLGVMVSIYNSMSDRRHEIAVMRALGASRLVVMLVILLESILLSLGGGLLGLLLGHGLIGALSPLILKHTGVAVGMLHFQTVELLLIPGLVILASAVGYLPALAAYRTDVARSLTSTP